MDLLLWCAGVAVGSIVTFWGVLRIKCKGLIRIHPNDEQGNRPYLFLELDVEPEKLKKKKYVVFRIKNDHQ